MLNALPTDAATKITIINRRLNPVDFERGILMEERWDGLDNYREEANGILKRRAAESNNLVQEKYVTLSIPQKKIDEVLNTTTIKELADDYTARIGKE